MLLLLAQLPAVPSSTVSCTGGLTIAHSNVTAASPCSGVLGDECSYLCDEGFLAIGRHVCQTYEAGGKTFIDRSFYGGRCEPLCRGTPACAADETAIRVNDTAKGCLSTRCFPSADAALKNVARGNVEAWRLARNNASGLYLDGVNLIDTSWTTTRAATGPTGLGLMFEVVAHALGWQTLAELRARVTLTLRSLVGKTAGVSIARDDRGFLVHFIDAASGGDPAPSDSSCLMCSGLLMAGALFTRSYLLELDAAGSAEAADLVAELWTSIRFKDLLCDVERKVVDPANGTGIPMTQAIKGDGCPSSARPDSDGYYQFNEEHYTVWFSYVQACGGGPDAPPAAECKAAAAEAMWAAWEGRRLHPNHVAPVGGYPLLSEWSGYLVQLPYYATQFNSDATYQALFADHWRADWAYFNQSLLAGERGRYGLGAGPSPGWCTEGSGYIADRLDAASKSHCRIYSPYIIAGYLPAAPDVIKPQLLQLLEDGEAVVPVPGTEHVVLWRKAMLEPAWPQAEGGAVARLTMVDFSSELFGMATLWLGADFFRKHTDYFKQGRRARVVEEA